MNKPAVILGGGLWGGLLAWKLSKKRPDFEFVLYEGQDSLGGNHTWSFHESDIHPKDLTDLKPLIRKSWPHYSVAFPSYRKTVKIPYHSISSSGFHEVLTKEIPSHRLKLGQRISLEEAKAESPLVFDCRGLTNAANCGHQKFLGIELETNSPHGLLGPVVMDATVDQIDGFRFIYILPFDERTLLIEDTRYSDDSFLDQFRIKEHIKNILDKNGWELKRIIREEIGALPIPFTTEKPSFDAGVADLRGIFHETTGYSLPDAVRLIGRITGSSLEGPEVQSIIRTYREKREANSRFFCLLNRMMFEASQDEERFKALEFFYRNNEKKIQRFYSGEMTLFDKFTFFIGKPPVKISRAMKVISGPIMQSKDFQ